MPVSQRYIFMVTLAVMALISLIALPAAAASGSIRVFSTPTEAYVCIDNYQCGYTTEQFDSLSANTYHTVTVSMDGYQTYSESVLVTAQSTYVVNANLQPVMVSTGNIEVHSTPYATACVDGGDCQPTTATFSGLAGNSYHTITVSLNGYQTYYDTVLVTPRDTSVVDAVLQPSSPATGSVQIYITPGGGTICIDGGQCVDNVGTTDGSGSHQFIGIMANAYHTVTVTANGYQRFITEIYVQPDQVNEANIYLQPLTSPTGSVQVYITPGGGTVCLDGARCDANVGSRDGTGSTRFAGVQADSQHTITVTTTGYLPYSSHFMVLPNQINELDISLQQLAQPTAAPIIPATTALPPPVSTTPIPRPTQSPVSAVMVILAIGICGAVLLFGKRG